MERYNTLRTQLVQIIVSAGYSGAMMTSLNLITCWD